MSIETVGGSPEEAHEVDACIRGLIKKRLIRMTKSKVHYMVAPETGIRLGKIANVLPTLRPNWGYGCVSPAYLVLVDDFRAALEKIWLSGESHIKAVCTYVKALLKILTYVLEEQLGTMQFEPNSPLRFKLRKVKDERKYNSYI